MVIYRMGTSESPFPDEIEFLQRAVKDLRVREAVKLIVIGFYKSYKKGHKGVDKQKAYLNASSQHKILDWTLLDIFNKMTYGER